MSERNELPCVEKTIALVYETFRGVTREGGVSWTESVARDFRCNEAACARARLEDKDTSWEQLVDDPEWNHDLGTGGFSFVDAIGFRYYIAPAMIRELHRVETDHGGINFHLTRSAFTVENWSAFTLEQKQCICEVLKCLIRMIVADFDGDTTTVDFEWQMKPYRSYWISIDQNPLREEDFS
jgi:hypothetical protein